MDNDSDGEYDDIELDDSGRPIVSGSFTPAPTSRGGIAVLPPIPPQRATLPRAKFSSPAQEGEHFNIPFPGIMNFDIAINPLHPIVPICTHSTRSRITCTKY